MNLNVINTGSHTFRSPKLKSVVTDAIHFFCKTPFFNLPPPNTFTGAGVYALYYLGDQEPYAPIGRANQKSCIQPIYVGKAVPPGWRTARIETSSSQDLSRRLREHANSIKSTSNLNLEDFRCRFMILDGVEGDLVVPVEATLIRKFKPLWNNTIDGFGNHDPGSGRYDQSLSEWDVLHPGRSWAIRLKGIPPKKKGILAKVIRSLN